MENCRISVLDSIEKLESIREQWNGLLTNSSMPSTFLTWEWLEAWSENFINKKRTLFVLLVYDGDEIIGIAPWCIHHIVKTFFSFKQIEFLGTPETGSDYLDVLIKKGKEKDVSFSIYEFLFRDAIKFWDKLWLHDIPSNSIFLMHFLNQIREDGKYVGIEEASFCPIVVLPNSEDDFYAQLSQNRRKMFKQHLRYLKKNTLVEHRSFSSNNMEAALKDFFKLYEKKTPWSGADLYRQVKNYMEKMGDSGSVQIDFLTDNGVPIGGLLHLRFNNTLYMYLMAIDKEYNPKISVGNTLVGLAILNAIRAGITYYDFLKGWEDYKFHWTNYGRRSYKIVLSQRKIVPILWTLKDIIKSAGKLVLR